MDSVNKKLSKSILHIFGRLLRFACEAIVVASVIFFFLPELVFGIRGNYGWGVPACALLVGLWLTLLFGYLRSYRGIFDLVLLLIFLFMNCVAASPRLG